MRYSPESLLAFVTTVDAGSFSAAARRLHKSQSTISAAIANLEADLGLMLFDRSGHQPTLTLAGRKVLSHVQAILSASEDLDELAIRLANHIEPRLTFMLSDIWQAAHYEPVLLRFAQQFPDIEFECLIAEGDDVIDLLQMNRAHVGILRAQADYPPDVAAARLQVKTEMALFVSAAHPLAAEKTVTRSQLATVRQLYLNTYKRSDQLQPEGSSGLHRPTLCCWKWRNKGTAGACFRAGWWRNTIGKSWWSCLWRAGRSGLTSTLSGLNPIHPALLGCG